MVSREIRAITVWDRGDKSMESVTVPIGFASLSQ